MIEATATVVRGIRRKVRVSVPVVCRNVDGQVRYTGVATAEFNIPVGDPVPVFQVDVRVVTEELVPEVRDERGVWGPRRSEDEADAELAHGVSG